MVQWVGIRVWGLGCRVTDVAAVLDPLEVLVDVVEELRDDHVRPRVHLREQRI